MTEFFVVVTLDLDSENDPDYDCINENLESLGLKKTIKAKDDTDTDLPYNTYAGKVSGDSYEQVRENLSGNIKAAFKDCGETGKFFVLVCEDYLWRMRSVK